MPQRPIIGVSAMNDRSEYGGALMAVRPTYLRAIEAAGGIPLLIHLTDDLRVVRSLYDLCDAILLPGGGDVDPALYGEEPHPELGEVDPQRDRVEIQLARWTREDRKPLLGICRGLQVINVAFGGSLYQDIPSQIEDSLDHRANTRTREWSVLTHRVHLDPSSWLAEQLSADEMMGNTMHHQAAKAIAPGLRAVGHAPDGVVEALESTGEQLVVAVQCHPEHLWHTSEPRWRRMFEGFIAACHDR